MARRKAAPVAKTVRPVRERTYGERARKLCDKGQHELAIYPADERFEYCVRRCGFARWAVALGDR